MDNEENSEYDSKPESSLMALEVELMSTGEVTLWISRENIRLFGVRMPVNQALELGRQLSTLQSKNN